MKTYTAVVEKDQETGLYVGYVPGFTGAHSQGSTLEELRENLVEVISMLLEDEDGRATTVPFHKGGDISPTLLRKIASDIDLTIEEFLNS